MIFLFFIFISSGFDFSLLACFWCLVEVMLFFLKGIVPLLTFLRENPSSCRVLMWSMVPEFFLLFLFVNME